MNITNLEMAQATIEGFGALICFMAIIIIFFNKSQKQCLKSFIYMFITGAFLLIFEAMAYIFRGNTNTFSIIVTRVSNFVVFTLNVTLSVIFIRYLYKLCNSIEIKPKKIYKYISEGLAIGVVLLLIVNIFTGIMYTFDSDNYYHRENWYYLYLVLSLGTIIPASIVNVRYWKSLGNKMAVTNMIFIVFPIIAAVIQYFIYGISITTMGIAMTLVLMLVVYLIEWGKKENDSASAEKQTKLLETVSLFVIMVLSMSASILSCIISIHRISKENSEKESLTIGEMITSGIECELLEPIMVSKTMSVDDTLITMLEKSKIYGSTSIEEDMKDYLSSIATKLGYQQAFVGSSYTNTYYVTSGIQKENLGSEEHDIWYTNIMASDKDYELNLDTDEGNDGKLAIFINKKLYDDSGTPMAIVGVGVYIDNLQQLLKDYETKYNVKISMASIDGLIQLDSDSSKIEKDYVDNKSFSSITTEFTYTKKGNTASMIRYVESCDWYLIVTDLNPEKLHVMQIITPPLIIFLVGIVMLGMQITIITVHERRTYAHMMEKKKQSITDEMSGLLNRRAYEDTLEILSQNKEFIVIMMDLNGLKRANDNLGHEAGDELIVGFSHLLLNVFSHSKCYRVGGDEFVILSTSPEDKLKEDIETLDYLCKTFNGKHIKEISYSYGYASNVEFEGASISEIIHKADERMYQNKEEFYKRTGLERRK